MRRDDAVALLDDGDDVWDVVIIGGGATGLGAAVEAASRGYRTLLIEKSDFGKGTSSRSTKLVHGGVRYLQQGNVSLVLEALRERGRLIQNAPHLVGHLRFVVPNYDWWEGPFYGVGLKLYDMLAGKLGLGQSTFLSRDETLSEIPTIEPEGLRGGISYYDGQFDDARLAVALAQTAVDNGATVVNYMDVVALLKNADLVTGVVARDRESDVEHQIKARVVINATGVFTDAVRRMDDAEAKPVVRASQGIHFVLDRSFLPSDSAIMIPRTEDKRVLFAVPWHNRIVLGTTDTPVESASLEPEPLEEEVTYLFEHAARYLTKDPARSDVLSVFAGLRPLVAEEGNGATSGISRDHVILISPSGLVTITGGKWTTYRKMAEDVIDQAAAVGNLSEQPSVTADLRLHGYTDHVEEKGPFSVYGTDAPSVQDVVREVEGGDLPVHPRLSYRRGEVVWAVRHEMARTVDDVLARRSRSLIFDARASREAAETVAHLMARELDRRPEWIAEQARTFADLAAKYILD